jgi:hypothetical protein
MGIALMLGEDLVRKNFDAKRKRTIASREAVKGL